MARGCRTGTLEMFTNILHTHARTYTHILSLLFYCSYHFSFLLSSGKVISSEGCRQNHSFFNCVFPEHDRIKASQGKKTPQHKQESSFSCLLLICFLLQMLLTLFKINRNKNILEKNLFRDAGNSADVRFSICIENTILVYNHIRHHRQHWLAKMVTIRSHVSLPNFFWPLLL